MLRVLSVFATQNHGPGIPRVPELAVRTLSTRRDSEPGGLKISDELADFTRHWRARSLPGGYLSV
jgi:hypothetical protein